MTTDQEDRKHTADILSSEVGQDEAGRTFHISQARDDAERKMQQRLDAAGKWGLRLALASSVVLVAWFNLQLL